MVVRVRKVVDGMQALACFGVVVEACGGGCVEQVPSRRRSSSHERDKP